MGLDFVNRHVAKILLAVRDGDSINKISTRTGSSYSYTYEWIQRLEEAEVLKIDNGIRIVDEGFVASFRAIGKTVLRKDLALDEAYLLPNFSDMEYRFSKTDAVYIWTKGGYQVGRDRNDYPIFVDVHREDVAEWQRFFDEFGVETTVGEREQKQGIHFVLHPVDEIEAERMDSASVTPLSETVEWAQQYRANFQPALEMLDEIHDLDLGVEYRERNVI
jgi:hypothetical protein